MALTATLLSLACASDDIATAPERTPGGGCPEGFVFVGYDWEGSIVCLE